MGPTQRIERCGTCRFWDSGATECRRHAPVFIPMLPLNAGDGTGANPGGWPRTSPDAWCGEWALAEQSPVVATATHVPAAQTEPEPPRDRDIATHLFLTRLAPFFETANPTALLETLLNQLTPDIRRVVVRVHGLDGRPVTGLKEVARDLKMGRESIRALLTAGEKRLAEAVQGLTRQQEKR